jgi:PAS domain S-box-containing protein
MPTAPLPPLDLLPVFNAQPGANLLLSPDWVIVGASDDYLAATLTVRDTLVGQHIFDAFPDNPDTPEANGVANVRASLEQVMATRQPHDMAPQHYDVPDPARPGHFVERHWKPRHTPVLDAGGQVQFIIQSVQDITDNRLAERELRASQASEQVARADAAQQRTEFRHFIEQAPVAVAVYRGPEFRVEMANATTLAIWGRPLEAVLGRPVFEVLPETDTPEVRAIFERVFATATTYTASEQATTIFRHGQLEEVYWNIVFEPQRGGDGRVSGLFTIGTDVTAQVRARQQLEQFNQALEARVQERTREALALQADLLAAAQRRALEREQFYQIFAQTPAALCVQRGPEHRYEYANAAYQQLFSGRDLIGLAVADALPETVESGVVSLLDHVYQTGETYYGYELPLLITQPEGPPKRMYFTFTYQAYHENGQIVGISTFAYDVAEQVLARQQLEQREASFRTMADAAPAMLWVTDPEGYCTYLNARWYEFTGQTEAEALGLGWTTAVHPDDAEAAGRLFLDANARRVLFHMRYRLRRHDGVYRWATDTGWPRFTDTGEYAGIVGTVIDIHEQQLAEEELQTSNEQLRRTNVDLDNFIYTASHDLKAPISNIEGLLYLLQDELHPEMAQEGLVGPTLTRMLDSVERFKRTIEHLTEVSKLQKEHASAATLVNLAVVVEDVRQDLQPALLAAKARLVVDVPAVPAVQFSEKNLRSIVYNLLSNAIKYHSPDRLPRIDVRAHVRPGHTVLEVHDNGLGIAGQHLPRLFNMFQRFHDHVEGSGIGLYMVKRMVENGGGRIEVHSQLGAGTTFFVHLPHQSS